MTGPIVFICTSVLLLMKYDLQHRTLYRIRILSRRPAPTGRRATLALVEQARQEIIEQVEKWKHNGT